MAPRQRQAPEVPDAGTEADKFVLYHPVTGDPYETTNALEATRLRAHGYRLEPRGEGDAPAVAGPVDPRLPTGEGTLTGGPFLPPHEDDRQRGDEGQGPEDEPAG